MKSAPALHCNTFDPHSMLGADPQIEFGARNSRSCRLKKSGTGLGDLQWNKLHDVSNDSESSYLRLISSDPPVPRF
ncbi:hypothetical protein WAI453_001848 [Rhynchosporium graminicola]